MSDIAEYYPPNPSGVPEDLTLPSGSYQSRVTLVLCSLLLFVLLYFAMVGGSAYLSYKLFSMTGNTKPRSVPATNFNNRTTSRPGSQILEKEEFWYIVGGIASGVLCLYLIKGFFKRRESDPSMMIEIQRKDQPRLFSFIDQICEDTGAPEPHKIFLTPEVNAAVFYHESLLSLVRKTPKNLLIGLGLVNRLNLSEFKAVLAHEFGHFSQNSMKLGTYVYTANRVVGDLVYGRDKLDGFIDTMKRVDIRVGIFFYAFSAVLWILRKFLELVFKAINFANFSLSRQMEFNADLVAVSVTGSDALIFALSKLDLASEALGQAAKDLNTAADHKLYTRDLFYHQTCALELLRRIRKNPNLGESPALPEDSTKTVAVFKAGDEGAPSMWATHPSNYDREQNAKEIYVRGEIDARSPWILFDDKAEVRERLTRRFYKIVYKLIKPALQDPAKVQEFIDNEHNEMMYDPRYQGMFDSRYIKPGNLEEIVQEAQGLASSKRAPEHSHETLFSEDLKNRMEKHRERLGEQQLLNGLQSGEYTLKGKDLKIREETIRLKDISKFLKKLDKELDEDYSELGKLDRLIIRTHLHMAYLSNRTAAEELRSRYEFHLKLQEILKQLIGQRDHVMSLLTAQSAKSQVSPAEFKEMVAALREARDTLETQLAVAAGMSLPALKNINQGESLSVFLLSEPLVPRISKSASSLDGETLGALLNQLGTVIDKCERLHFKSLGNILSLQEKIEREFKDPSQRPGSIPEKKPELVAKETGEVYEID